MYLNTRYNCDTNIPTKITKSKELEISKKSLQQTFVTYADTANKDNDYLCQQLNQNLRLQSK